MMGITRGTIWFLGFLTVSIRPPDPPSRPGKRESTPLRVMIQIAGY